MIYLDYAASCPMRKEALEEYCSLQADCFANPGSTHAFGRKADRVKEASRKEILSLFGLSQTHSLLFTSGATESNNTALKSIALLYQNRGKKIISSSAEHSSVYSTLIQLRDQFGFEVVFLNAKKDGAIDLGELKKELDSNTILVSIMAINNETGAISPVKEIAEILKQYPKCFFHCDATQAVGKESFDYKDVDLISSSAHKFGGPKGVGFLLYKKAIRFLPLHSGGSQESDFRAGTEDVPSIGAMALAFRLALLNQKKEKQNALERREQLLSYLSSRPDLYALNSPEGATPFILNVYLKKHKASVILEALSENNIYVSSLSACNAKKTVFSRPLASMGFDEERSSNSLRFSFGEGTTEEDIASLIEALETILKEVRPR